MSKKLIIKYILGVLALVVHTLEMFAINTIDITVIFITIVILIWNLIDYEDVNGFEKLFLIVMFVGLIFITTGSKNYNGSFKNFIYLFGGLLLIIPALIDATIIDKNK